MNRMTGVPAARLISVAGGGCLAAAIGTGSVWQGLDMGPKTPGTEKILNGSAIHLLHRAGQCAGDVFAREVSAGGLTPRQFAVLVAVAQNEGQSQTDLVERTGIDRSTLADIIRRMLKKGLLSRRRTRADARAYSVRLTPRGREALLSAEPAAITADARVLAALPPAKRRDFLDCLNTIVHAIESPDGSGAEC
jgi:DNA-binding MarR family transcriptional regulator